MGQVSPSSQLLLLDKMPMIKNLPYLLVICDAFYNTGLCRNRRDNILESHAIILRFHGVIEFLHTGSTDVYFRYAGCSQYASFNITIFSICYRLVIR